MFIIYPFHFFFQGRKFSFIGRNPQMIEEFKFNYTETQLKSSTVKEH
jgi:hypothetical protein